MFAIGFVLLLATVPIIRTDWFPYSWQSSRWTWVHYAIAIVFLAGGFLMLGSAALFFWRVMP